MKNWHLLRLLRRADKTLDEHRVSDPQTLGLVNALSTDYDARLQALLCDERGYKESALHLVSIFGTADDVRTVQKSLISPPEYSFKTLNDSEGLLEAALTHFGVSPVKIKQALESDLKGTPADFASFFGNTYALNQLAPIVVDPQPKASCFSCSK